MVFDSSHITALWSAAPMDEKVILIGKAGFIMQERFGLERELAALGVWQPMRQYQAAFGGLPVPAFQHIHQPMKPDPKAEQWVPDGPEKPLSPLNPGFVDNVTGQLKIAAGLQAALKNLLTVTPEFKKHLASKSSEPAKGDRFRIALIDLTRKKLLDPEFAGWGSTVAEYGASAVKIAPLYAAFQLLNDLKSLKGPTTVGDLITAAKKAKFLGPPKFVEFLDPAAAPPNIKFSQPVKEAMMNLLDPKKANCASSLLIDKVGFPYVGSVMKKSGLRHPTRGGIWLRWNYGCPKREMWSGADSRPPPEPVYVHNATALSLATFYTLMAQRRLVTPGSSDKIKSLLTGASWFTDDAALGPSARVASKVGIWGKYIHEAALVENAPVRYAVAILTVGIPVPVGFLNQLIVKLNTLIVANN
jgi:hypothetical protein